MVATEVAHVFQWALSSRSHPKVALTQNMGLH